MRKLSSLLVLMNLFILAFAQQTVPTDNLLLGYQEFPTTIHGHTADAVGNQYYTGIFRGDLTVNGQVLATGNGLEEIFWVKTNPAGGVIRHKVFGTTNSEHSYTNALALGANSRMVFGINTLQTLTLGATSITPYPSATGNGFASALVCTDTAGNVLWSKRTTLQNFRIYFHNNIYHVLGPVVASLPAIKYGDAVVTDSVGQSGIVHLMVDENGNLLAAKTIKARKSGQGISLLNAGFFSDNSLFLQLRADGDTAFHVNNQPIQLPNLYSSYHVFMRTDTSYTGIISKMLNSNRHTMGGMGSQYLPACVGSGDSVYTVLSHENNGLPFSLDGFSQTPQRNTMYVMDASLTVRRQVFLGNSAAGSYPTNPFRRKVYFRHALFQNGQLFLAGAYNGINESPINAIAPRDTVMNLLPELPVTINQNGGTRSFVAKYNPTNGSGAVTWYGDHSDYENMIVAPVFLHSGGPSRIAFVQSHDNVWNPWTVDENLTVVSGSMRKNADGPETSQMLQYFADGSRVVVGYARGKTALDGPGTFTSNASRRDMFIVRLRPNNTVVWYKRFHSTLTNAEIRGLEISNGKAYFLTNYLSTQNDSNYLRVGTDLYSVRLNASLLANVDTAGNLSVLNLTNPILRSAYLLHFSFFSNGDLAVLTDGNPLLYAAFPYTFGPSILRVNTGSGAILAGRKLTGVSNISMHTIRIDRADRLYLSGASSYPQPYKLFMHNGTAWADSIPVPPNSQVQGTVIKMDWNRFTWLKRFSGGAFIRQIGDVAIAGDKVVLGVMSSPTNQAVLWDGQTVHNGYPTPTYSLLRLNEDGSMAQKKVLPGFSANYMRSGSGGGIYISGTSRSAMNVDTIAIGHAGGVIDALGLVYDSTLTAKRSFRVGSPYSEAMWDMAIHHDSIVALAYSSQTAPQVYLNRVMATAGDQEEDAYVGTLTIGPNMVTGLNNPLPPLHAVTIAPNPVTDLTLRINASVPESLRTTVTVYRNGGEMVASSILQLRTGSQRYQVLLPPTTAKGTYHVVMANKRWVISRSVLVL